MYAIFSAEERAAAARFLEESGIASPGTRVDAMTMLGYLASVIRFTMLDFPAYEAVRMAAARYQMFEEAAAAAAVRSDVGLGYSRADELELSPDAPPPGVDGTQLGTRAALMRPRYLDGPAEPVCMVDVETLFCQTHQGVHVSEDAQIFDLLKAEAPA